MRGSLLHRYSTLKIPYWIQLIQVFAFLTDVMLEIAKKCLRAKIFRSNFQEQGFWWTIPLDIQFLLQFLCFQTSLISPLILKVAELNCGNHSYFNLEKSA